jgi:hypothetical protein
MTDRITRSFVASTPDGLSVAVNDYVDVEAVDKLEVTALKDSTPLIVSVQPVTPGGVQFVAVVAESYDDLLVSVDSGDPIALDGPLILMMEGIVALLGATCNVMTFVNSSTEADNDITILVGRDAVGGGM